MTEAVEAVYKKPNGKWYYKGEFDIDYGPYPTEEKARQAYQRYLAEARPAS